MKDFEAFIVSFGFREDPFLVAILCIVVLLSNFTGGLFSNIILAMSGRLIVERPLLQRTSFRLAAASEFFFIVFIVYYHAIATSEIVIAQVIFWTFTVVCAPLLAMLGAQIGYLGFKKKIEELKSGGEEADTEKGTEEMPQPEVKAADPDG